MNDFKFSLGDTVTYENRAGARSRGNIIHRYYDGALQENVYYIELLNPVFPVVAQPEKELKKVEEI